MKQKISKKELAIAVTSLLVLGILRFIYSFLVDQSEIERYVAWLF